MADFLNGILSIGKSGGATKGAIVGQKDDENAKKFKIAMNTYSAENQYLAGTNTIPVGQKEVT